MAPDTPPAQGNNPDSDRAPAWIVPYWMILALFSAFAAGVACGSILTWLLNLGPLGPAD
jgi:hypothetical protein